MLVIIEFLSFLGGSRYTNDLGSTEKNYNGIAGRY